jgi:Carboxypeptidase regulatory-like domain
MTMTACESACQGANQRKLRVKAILWLFVAAFAVLFSLPAFSQLDYGSISGTITDPSGAVVVGAKVTVTNVDQGTQRILTTDKAGTYNAPSLIPGNYSVTRRSPVSRRWRARTLPSESRKPCA